MKRHHIFRYGAACMGIVGMLMLAACAAEKPNESHQFRPEDVSCTDRSTPDAWKERKEDNSFEEDARVYGGPAIDLPGWITAVQSQRYNSFLDHKKKLAELGNAHGMQEFGTFRALQLLILNGFEDDARTIYRNRLPDQAKDEMVRAITYLLLAVNSDNSYRDEAQSRWKRIFYSGKISPIPPAWAEEAKHNVTRWQHYCAKQLSNPNAQIDLAPILEKISVPRPNNQPVHQATIFISDEDEPFTHRVRDSDRFTKNTYGDNYLAQPDQFHEILAQIMQLPKGLSVNLVGYGFGGATAVSAAKYLAQLRPIYILTTIDLEIKADQARYPYMHPYIGGIDQVVHQWVTIKTDEAIEKQ